VPAIYHITHVSNLAGIVTEGGLHCDATVAARTLSGQSIAHSNIKARRAVTTVPCGPGGLLPDYVPFYFAPRSPMLFVISKGGVETYPSRDQSAVVHLVSSTETISGANLPFVFTDGHGIMALTNFHEDLKELEKIDWKVIRGRYWNDTNDDNDRCRRRNAEFLVHSFVPISCISEIGVMTPAAVGVVAEAVKDVDPPIQIHVRRAWYY